jgi:predicted outer membrane repeat protein
VTHPNNCFLLYQRCHFKQNQLTGEDETSVLGGVIDVWGEELSEHDKEEPAVTTIECIFELHETFSGSSVALNRAGYHDINSTFLNNIAKLDGAGFMTINSYIKLEGSKFINSFSELNGGAISLREASIADIIGCEFRNSRAKRGGAVAADIASNMSIKNSKFINNTAEIGSIILISNGDNYRSEIINSTFINNSAAFSALIVVEYAQLDLNTSFFYDSLANILSLSETNGTLSYILFKDTLCKFLLEGCIGAIKDNSFINFSNIRVENLQTESKGGVFDVYLSTLDLKDSYFTNINSTNDGGLINALFSKKINLFNISVINFTPDGISAEQSSIIITNSLFQSKESYKLKRSAIVCLKCEELGVFGTKFDSIMTWGNAPAIFVQQNQSKSENFKVESCIFINNVADESGGAIYNEDAVLILKKNEFQKNKAKIGGAIVHNCIEEFEICIIDMESNKFIDNKALEEGGVIKWLYNRPRNYEKNEFTGNNAGTYGDNVASFPIKFGLRIYKEATSNDSDILYDYKNKNLSVVSIDNEKSGGVIIKRLEFDLLDTEGQVYKGKKDVILKAELVKDGNYSLKYPWIDQLNQSQLQTRDSYFNNSKINLYC